MKILVQLGWMDDRREGLFACHSVEGTGFWAAAKK
jgi:hypothetical protein